MCAKPTEDTLLALADHLPSEAAEALLELATGGTPEISKPAPTGADPFATRMPSVDSG